MGRKRNSYTPTKSRALDAHIEVWERQPKEIENAWQAFLFYRDMDLPRSQRKAGESINVWRSQIGKWATMWRWEERCEAYDRHLDRHRLHETERAIRKTAKKHAEMADTALAVLSLPIRELIRRYNANEIKWATISDAELFRFVRQAAPSIRHLVDVEETATGAKAARRAVKTIKAPDGTNIPANPASTGKTMAEIVADLFDRAQLGASSEIIDADLVDDGDDDDVADTTPEPPKE